jgi:hypothetical protein
LITHDELKRVFKLLKRHEDLLIDAAVDRSGVVDETAFEVKHIEALIDARLLWRPASDEPVRLARELTGLFDRILRDPRRMTLDADIGGFIISIENNVNHYKEAVRANSRDDVSHYLGQIERLVDDLRSSLLDSSGQLWQKIASDFGYVTDLKLKISENEAVIAQARRLNDSLELIKPREMGEFAGHDPKLKRYLLKWLLDSVEVCRRETVDATHKLNDLLFEFRRQQSIGRLIDSFYRKFQANPGYTPFDYTAGSNTPEVFNQVSPVALMGQADLGDPNQETALTGIVVGLRKERPANETVERQDAISVEDDEPPISSTLEPLSQAVEDFYTAVVESPDYVSALDMSPPENVESDIEIWLYAVISRYNNMDMEERALFDMHFNERLDPIFNGRNIVSDVKVKLRRGTLGGTQVAA